jgi:radical SAM superfamily enzyme YgiQ (UPF0313 family)
MKHASASLAMVYPSPYHVGMSSLGFQTLYRLVNDTMEGWSAERAFLPEDPDTKVALETLESGRPVSDHHAIGISVAYELEIFGLVRVLELSGLAPLARDRRRVDPPVLIGGPLTFSNPLPVAPFADAVLLGECEELLPRVLEVFARKEKHAALEEIATFPSVLVPQIHGEILPSVAAATNALLPAKSAILTPDTELSSMFLIEAERGCHRNCTFCVMRRSTNGGMRLAPVDVIVEAALASGAKKVGLVGAAVSDHPKIVELLSKLVDTHGFQVGISSLRADRLTDDFVRLLAKGGYRTLTVASDAPSQRLRDDLEKRIKERHLIASAELARKHGLRTLKTYMMIGTPTETDEDIDELVRFSRELSKISPVAIGVAPFVPKYNTPLAEAVFAGEDVAFDRMERLRKGLRGAADVRTTSTKEAFVEAALATAGFSAADRVLASQQDGYGWKTFYRSLKKQGALERRPQHFIEPFAKGRTLLTKLTAASIA